MRWRTGWQRVRGCVRVWGDHCRAREEADAEREQDAARLVGAVRCGQGHVVRGADRRRDACEYSTGWAGVRERRRRQRAAVRPCRHHDRPGDARCRAVPRTDGIEGGMQSTCAVAANWAALAVVMATQGWQFGMHASPL